VVRSQEKGQGLARGEARTAEDGDRRRGARLADSGALGRGGLESLLLPGSTTPNTTGGGGAQGGGGGRGGGVRGGGSDTDGYVTGTRSGHWSRGRRGGGNSNLYGGGDN